MRLQVLKAHYIFKIRTWESKTIRAEIGIMIVESLHSNKRHLTSQKMYYIIAQPFSLVL